MKNTGSQDELARRIANHLLNLQSRVANFLNDKMGNRSGIFLVGALVFVLGSYCLYLLLHAFV